MHDFSPGRLFLRQWIAERFSLWQKKILILWTRQTIHMTCMHIPAPKLKESNYVFHLQFRATSLRLWPMGKLLWDVPYWHGGLHSRFVDRNRSSIDQVMGTRRRCEQGRFACQHTCRPSSQFLRGKPRVFKSGCRDSYSIFRGRLWTCHLIQEPLSMFTYNVS